MKTEIKFTIEVDPDYPDSRCSRDCKSFLTREFVNAGKSSYQCFCSLFNTPLKKDGKNNPIRDSMCISLESIS